MENKKKTKEKIPSTLRNTVWNYYVGDNLKKSKCSCCKIEDISFPNFHCGHIISEKNGGKLHIDNLKPVCSQCNTSMGCKNMDDFMEKYGFNKIKAKAKKVDLSNQNTKKVDLSSQNTKKDNLLNQNAMTDKFKYFCDLCNFSSNDSGAWCRHKKTFKHIRNHDKNKLHNINSTSEIDSLKLKLSLCEQKLLVEQYKNREKEKENAELKKMVNVYKNKQFSN